MSTTPAGFVPPDLTHPEEWLQAGHLAIQAGAWLLPQFLILGAVLAIAAWALRRQAPDAPGPLDAAAAGYARLAMALPTVALVVAMVGVAVGACGTLANRSHHDEQRARAAVLASYPDGKMSQTLPRTGHMEKLTEQVPQTVDGKTTMVEKTREVERYHYLAGSDVQAKILRKPDPVHPGRERFEVTFTGKYVVASPLSEPGRFFIDLPGVYNASLVRGLTVTSGGKALAPESEGGSRYWLDLPAQGKAEVQLSYVAEGLPRWVYDTQGARLVAFNLAIDSDVTNAHFASGVAPTKSESTPTGRKLTWSYPENAAISEPVGIFTAAGDLGMAGLLPRWLLLVPGLFAAWLLLLLVVARADARQLVLAGVLFTAAVCVTAAVGKLGAPALVWGLAGVALVFAGDRLGAERLAARLVTAFALVLPGVALLLPNTGLAMAASVSLLAAWLAWAQGDRQHDRIMTGA